MIHHLSLDLPFKIPTEKSGEGKSGGESAKQHIEKSRYFRYLGVLGIFGVNSGHVCYGIWAPHSTLSLGSHFNGGCLQTTHSVSPSFW